jgi:hypothetical protein
LYPETVENGVILTEMCGRGLNWVIVLKNGRLRPKTAGYERLAVKAMISSNKAMGMCDVDQKTRENGSWWLKKTRKRVLVSKNGWFWLENG